jgi:hypothetical protein
MATINDQNIQNIRAQIDQKKKCAPFLATINQTAEVITDYDTFPYPRWFRGVPQSSHPIIAEREAGWRTRQDQCYRVLQPMVDVSCTYPNHCFEAACSTVFPCYPEQLSKSGDRGALNVTLNRACIVEYR